VQLPKCSTPPHPNMYGASGHKAYNEAPSRPQLKQHQSTAAHRHHHCHSVLQHACGRLLTCCSALLWSSRVSAVMSWGGMLGANCCSTQALVLAGLATTTTCSTVGSRHQKQGMSRVPTNSSSSSNRNSNTKPAHGSQQQQQQHRCCGSITRSPSPQVLHTLPVLQLGPYILRSLPP
jgi:hypothetical protein